MDAAAAGLPAGTTAAPGYRLILPHGEARRGCVQTGRHDCASDDDDGGRGGDVDLPPLAELLALYDSVGWSAYTKDPDTLAASLAGSAAVVIVRVGGQLAGLARVVSDGYTICYLQDVLVRPEFQGRGIGRQLVQRVLAPFVHVRQKVLLTDDEPGQAAFYAALGFVQAGADGGGAGLRSFVRFD